ncbi:Uncharacterised protein g2672 [Pycnogonum litorale]
MQDGILSSLHYGHLGIEKSYLRAKDTVYWPNIKKDVEAMVKTCQICQEQAPSQCPEPLMPHEVPHRPWEVIGMDLFHLFNIDYLLISDYYSKFPIIRKLLKPCQSVTLTNVIKQVFSEYVVPWKVVSDNGPHFRSESFQTFANEWKFEHTTSSPRHPRANGHIERAVGTIKAVLTKARNSGQDANRALFALRATPIDAKLPSPGELLRGYKLSTPIPTTIQNNRRANTLPPLEIGQRIRFQKEPQGSWTPAEIIERNLESHSYTLQTPSGNHVRRNRVHIRDAPTGTTLVDTPVPEDQPACVSPSTESYVTRHGRRIRTPARFQS